MDKLNIISGNFSFAVCKYLSHVDMMTDFAVNANARLKIRLVNYYQFFTDPPEAWLPVHNGTFAIFFPEDAHLPLISPGQIHKVVVKVAVNQS
jgi:beta-galactosidase beta subunit